MEVVNSLRQLWGRKVFLIPVVVVAVVAALMSAYKLPSFHKRAVQMGAASSQILVDSPQSTLVQGGADATLASLSTRALVYAQYLSSLEARNRISAAAGIPAASISTAGPYSTEGGRTNYTPQGAEARASDLLKQGKSNRLVFVAQDGVPIITVSALSTDARDAVKLANASFVALKEYIATLAGCGVASATPAKGGSSGDFYSCKPQTGVVVRELGVAEGGTIGGSNGMLLMVVTFLGVVALGSLAIIVIPGVARHWRELDRAEQAERGLQQGGVSRTGERSRQPDAVPVEETGLEPVRARERPGRLGIGSDIGERSASVVP